MLFFIVKKFNPILVYLLSVLVFSPSCFSDNVPMPQSGSRFNEENPYKSLYSEYMSSKLQKMPRGLIDGAAKFERYSECDSGLFSFKALAREIQSFMDMQQDFSLDGWMQSSAAQSSVIYPFTNENHKSYLSWIPELYISLAAQYYGRGEQMAPVFWKKCMAIPLSLFTTENYTEEELAQWEEEERLEAIKRDKERAEEDKNDWF